jgi:hypothetical protein
MENLRRIDNYREKTAVLAGVFHKTTTAQRLQTWSEDVADARRSLKRQGAFPVQTNRCPVFFQSVVICVNCGLFNRPFVMSYVPARARNT